MGTGNEHNFIKVEPERLFDSMQTVEHLRIGLGSRIIDLTTISKSHHELSHMSLILACHDILRLTHGDSGLRICILIQQPWEIQSLEPRSNSELAFAYSATY